jgi:hypothetical protein
MMPPDYPRELYRAPSKKVLRQGDIGLCEFTQLRPRSGERAGPGAEATASTDLPYFGQAADYEIVVGAARSEQSRILRLWEGPVMVVSQNCELEHADEADSRLLVAPLVNPGVWPDGRWEYLRQNRLPGYLYLPALAAGDAGFDLGLDLPEAAVALGSITLVSRALVRHRRLASLGQPMLPLLQEKLSRFLTTRGYASERELGALGGKRVVSVERTDETVPGPSRLYKVTLGESGDAGGDDELTVAFGCRSV